MTTFTRLLAASAVVALATAATPALAGPVIFVPPSDTTGSIFSSNGNDGYSQGRGVVFSPTANATLTNVALYEDLTNVTLNYSLRLATATTGNVGGGAVLASGSTNATTSGLQFIDFSLAPLTLTAGTYYFLDFGFTGNGNQNFFYNQSGAEPFAQAGFAGIDGTQNGGTANFVLPRIRLTIADATAAVPEPATWAMMLVGFGAMGFAMRRRQKVTARVRFA